MRPLLAIAILALAACATPYPPIQTESPTVTAEQVLMFVAEVEYPESDVWAFAACGGTSLSSEERSRLEAVNTETEARVLALDVINKPDTIMCLSKEGITL